MSLAGWNAPVKPRASSTALASGSYVVGSRLASGTCTLLRPLVTLLSVAVVGVLFGGLAVILAVPFTSAVATLMDVLVLGHEPPTEQPRRPLRLRRSG